MPRLKLYILIFTLLTGCLMPVTDVVAADKDREAEISAQLGEWYKQLKQQLSMVPYMTESRLKVAEETSLLLQKSWDNYLDRHKGEITDDCVEINNMIADFPNLQKKLAEAIASTRAKTQAQEDILLTAKEMEGIEEEFNQMYDKALKLSLVKNLAPQLDELKVSEQLRFSEITAVYEKAKQAAVADPAWTKRFEELERKYIQVKLMSQKIEALEYKPLFERIKDYILSLGAIAMVLLFFNMIQTKLKAAKDAKKSMKEMQKFIKKSQEDIPVI
ncbi:MAG: hypothetical protein HUJ89_06275 [Bacteroidales bacterium]|nr:hypothetical protein [Bacteroidales bacterium]